VASIRRSASRVGLRRDRHQVDCGSVRCAASSIHVARLARRHSRRRSRCARHSVGIVRRRPPRGCAHAGGCSRGTAGRSRDPRSAVRWCKPPFGLRARERPTVKPRVSSSPTRLARTSAPRSTRRTERDRLDDDLRDGHRRERDPESKPVLVQTVSSRRGRCRRRAGAPAHAVVTSYQSPTDCAAGCCRGGRSSPSRRLRLLTRRQLGRKR